jgi:uncharacterized metal-binding protein
MRWSSWASSELRRLPCIGTLARKVAISTTLFLLTIALIGTATLKFFGISLPVLQVSGGLVLAVMGWNLLSQNETVLLVLTGFAVTGCLAFCRRTRRIAFPH